jgi:hypothetical protein
LLLFPGPAFGVQSVTSTVTGSSFPLGSQVPGTVVIDLASDEFIGIGGANSGATVTLDVTGPQNVSFSMPLDVGPFVVNVNGSTLSGDIAHANVTTGNFTGYGYGYKAGNSGGTITIAFNFQHRILLSPLPLLLPRLPATPQEIVQLDLPGAVGDHVGTSAGGPPPFPMFEQIGDATVYGLPGDSQARALDARLPTAPHDDNPQDVAILAVILDGYAGENDVYAEIVVGMDQYSDSPFTYAQTFFTLPSPQWIDIDLGEVQGVTYITPTQIAVSGGSSPTGADAYVAVYNLTGAGSPGPVTEATFVSSVILSTLVFASGAVFDNRPGGVAFKGGRVLVAEFQEDASGQVTVASLNPADLGNGATAFDTPLAGTEGFEGFTDDPTSARLFGVTAPPPEGNVQFLALDPNDGSLQGSFVGDLPEFGQALTGLGMLPNNEPGAAVGETLMFAITMLTRRIVVSKVSAQGTGPAVGEFTNKPQAVDQDPTTGNLIIAVQGDPSNVVVMQADGTVVSGPSPIGGAGSGIEVGGGTFDSNGKYWVSATDQGLQKLYQVNPADGVIDGDKTITLPFFVGEIGALATKTESATVFLYAMEAFNDVFHKINSDTGTIAQTVSVFDFNYQDPFFPPGGANGATIGAVDGTDRLIIGRFDQLYEVSLDTGDLLGGWHINASDVTGLGAGSVLIADRGFPNNRILGVRLPGEPKVSSTTEGTYTLSSTVDNTPANEGPAVTSSTVSFALTKLADVTVTVSSPAAGAAFTTTPITVAGTVDDPTVSEIIISAGLASGTIVGFDSPSTFDESADQAQYTLSGLWGFEEADVPVMTANDGTTIAAGSNAVAYYGKNLDGSPNYSTNSGPPSSYPTQNEGSFKTPTFAVTGTGTIVNFDIWYATEPTPPPDSFGGFGLSQAFDRKMVQFCQDGNCQTLFHIVSVVPDPFSGGQFFFEPPPGFLPPGITIGQTFSVGNQTAMFVPRSRGGQLKSGAPQFTSVSFSLDSLNGIGQGILRVKFNSGDDFNSAPFEQGVIIDNLEIIGPLTTGESQPVTNGAFSFPLAIAEGENSTTLLASSAVPGTAQGTATFTTYLDTASPIVTLNAVTSPTTTLSQTIEGSFVEFNPKELTITVNGNPAISQKTFSDSTFSHLVGLIEGSNAIVVTLTDTNNASTTASATITVDNTGPVIQASVRGILSDTSLRAGDPFFVMVNATDAATGIGSVTHTLGGVTSTYATAAQIDEVIVKKHDLGSFNPTTTHIIMGIVPAGTAAGTLNLSIDATDGSGNVATTTVALQVVSILPSRNAYLQPGFNFIGFPLVPSSGLFETLLDREITNANPALTTLLGATPMLDDIVETIFTWTGGPASGSGAGSFTSFVPGPTADTLTAYTAKSGIIVQVRSTVTTASGTVDVFDTAANPTVSGGSDVTVPIKWTVAGSFLPSGATIPPTKTVVTGFNLITAHAKGTMSFDNVLRGALIPVQRAIDALTSLNQIDAVFDATAVGGVAVEVSQGAEQLFPGQNLEPMRAYWVRLADDPNAVVDPSI